MEPTDPTEMADDRHSVLPRPLSRPGRGSGGEGGYGGEGSYGDEGGYGDAGVVASSGRTLEELFDWMPPEPTREEVAAEGERLQKVLARLGIASRRVCEDMIAARRVRINGRVAEVGNRVDVELDQVTIDGVPVGIRPGLVYYLLNKPSGVVTTAKDPQGRPTVVELVPVEPRVFPVGRLDGDTEGLLLLTNDGDLTHRLTHPSFGVEKEYLAEVVGQPSPAALRALREGVELDDGWTAPAQAVSVAPSLVRITIHEGRNRQVRRMLDAVGHPVQRLVRTRIGGLADRSLRPGTWRVLTIEEVRALSSAAGPAPRPKVPVVLARPEPAAEMLAEELGVAPLEARPAEESAPGVHPVGASLGSGRGSVRLRRHRR